MADGYIYGLKRCLNIEVSWWKVDFSCIFYILLHGQRKAADYIRFGSEKFRKEVRHSGERFPIGTTTSFSAKLQYIAAYVHLKSTKFKF